VRVLREKKKTAEELWKFLRKKRIAFFYFKLDFLFPPECAVAFTSETVEEKGPFVPNATHVFENKVNETHSFGVIPIKKKKNDAYFFVLTRQKKN
jgi:hypothetical protein